MPTYLSPGVYVEEVEAGSRPIEGVGTAVAAFVGLAEKGPLNEPTLVSNWTQFSEKFGDFVPDTYLAHAVYGYFLNGGGNCFIVRIGGGAPAAAVNGKPAAGAQKAIAGPAQAQLTGYKVTAQASAPKTKTISVDIQDPSGENQPEDLFKLVVNVDGAARETYDHVSTKRGENNVVDKVNTASKLINIEELTSGSGLAKPDKGVTELAEPPVAPEAPSTDRLSADDYVGDPADRTGFSGLEAVDEVTMVAVPDLMAAYEQGAIDLEMVQAVQLAMIAHCELMGDRMAILDPPPGLSPPPSRAAPLRFISPWAPWLPSSSSLASSCTSSATASSASAAASPYPASLSSSSAASPKSPASRIPPARS